MERYEFSETEKQLLRALSEGKTPEELEQLFDTDVLEAHLNRLQELEMAVAHFSLGLLAAETESGHSYRRLIQSAIHIKMAVKASAIAMQLRMVFMIDLFQDWWFLTWIAREVNPYHLRALQMPFLYAYAYGVPHQETLCKSRAFLSYA